MRSIVAFVLLEVAVGLQTVQSSTFLGRVGNETRDGEQNKDYKSLQDEIDELHDILKAEMADNEDAVEDIEKIAKQSEDKLETAHAASEESIKQVEKTQAKGKTDNKTNEVVAEEMKEQAETTDEAREQLERITALAHEKLNSMKERTDKMIERYRSIATETEEMMVKNQNLETNLTRQSDTIKIAHETLHASMTSMKEADEILQSGIDYNPAYVSSTPAPSASYVVAAGAVVLMMSA